MPFMECGECASKPGMPQLCESCVHNRRLISELENEIDLLKEKIRSMETEKSNLIDRIFKLIDTF